ncbi:MAG: hypothetical protein N3B16_05180 [Candidatus Aminicenantes bacterium]|nr:hypothetical protein [Candidatus Aminicenantes bacterium]
MSWIIKSILALVIVNNCFLSDGISARVASARDENLSLILDRIVERVKTYPELNNWKASVVSVQTEMDKNWKPKKVTRVLKVVRVRGGQRTEEIKRAEEMEKGKTKDITQKYIREIEERRQEQKKREEGRKREEPAGEGSRQGRRSFSLDDFLPFSERNRGKYVFSKLEDEILDGKPVFVLQSRTKIRTEEQLEGQYFISQDTYDVLKAVLSLAKNPKFVKEFVAEIEFQMLPTGHFVLKKSKMKVDGGIVLKHVRMIIEEEYSDYEVIEGETASTGSHLSRRQSGTLKKSDQLRSALPLSTSQPLRISVYP